MSDDARPLIKPRLIAGILLLLLAGVFAADAAGDVTPFSARTLWPVGLVAVALILVLQGDTVNRLVGAVLLMAGAWLLFNELDIWGYSFWKTWPYLLMIFGGWMLYRVQLLRRREGPPGLAAFAVGRFDERIADADEIGALSFINDVERVATTKNFVGGDFHAVLGVCDIDLRHAATRGGAVIETLALLGRVDITVPAGWRVESRVLPLFGRVDDSTSAVDGGDNTVVVRGAAILGRVAVSVAD